MSLQALFPAIDQTLSTSDGTSLSTSSDFEVLALALDTAGLTDTVGGLQDFTLFAPTDQAFADMAVSFGFAGDTSDATAVFGAIAGTLSDLAEDGDPVPLLTDILLYHVAPDAETLSDLNGSGDVPTFFDGASFEVTGGTVVDEDPDATNADIIAADVDVGTGVIQVVDQVLLPLDTPINTADPTLLDVLKESGGAPDDDATDYDMLLNALQATGLDAAVEDPEAEITVFIPDDQAFIDLARGLGYDGDDEAGAFQTIVAASAEADPENPLALVEDILTFHVSPGEQDAASVLSSDVLGTLNGAEIAVDGTTLFDANTTNSDPTIVATDIDASNGIAHAIDAILLPPEAASINLQEDEDSAVAEDDGDSSINLLDALLFGGFIAILAGLSAVS